MFKDNVDTRFNKLEDDVAVLKTDVNRRFNEQRVDFERLHNRSQNSAIRNPFMMIHPILIYRPGIGMIMPDRFPCDTQEF